MRVVLKTISSVLLLVNGIGALWGGASLLRDTSGKSMGWPLEMLGHTPFSNYFIPGLILFISNGLFSLFVFFYYYFLATGNIHYSFSLKEQYSLAG